MRDGVPSRTACLVALGSLSFFRAHPAAWSPEAARLLEELLAGAPFPYNRLRRLVRIGPVRGLLSGFVHSFVPGMFPHYVARKKFIENAVRERLTDGARQVVVVGGGLDTLAARLAAESPSLRVIEVDHPATQRLKRHLQRVEFVPADLSVTPLESVLTLDPALPTVFVMEGLLMYFCEEHVRALFRSLAGLSRHATCVFTFMDREPDGTVAFRGGFRAAALGWLRTQREPFLWGVENREALSRFLATADWNLCDVSFPDQLRDALGVPGVCMAQGENVAIAELARDQTNT